MENTFNLKRFRDAQESNYTNALNEIRNGRKRSHWMWYIFPQIRGLGFSETSRYYGVDGLAEAKAYLADEVLGKRLLEICEALLTLQTNNATQVFGSPDDLKLKSSMTLFAAVENAPPVFQKVLDKFYGGTKDQQTLKLLKM